MDSTVIDLQDGEKIEVRSKVYAPLLSQITHMTQFFTLSIENIIIPPQKKHLAAVTHAGIVMFSTSLLPQKGGAWSMRIVIFCGMKIMRECDK